MTDTRTTEQPVYVCPQCGPDPLGEQGHAWRKHSAAGLFDGVCCERSLDTGGERHDLWCGRLPV